MSVEKKTWPPGFTSAAQAWIIDAGSGTCYNNTMQVTSSKAPGRVSANCSAVTCRYSSFSPASSAWSLATDSAAAAMSMPVTSAPRIAMLSARMPPPQPTSITFLPARPARWLMYSSLSGLMSCSGLYSLCGSHQRMADCSNLATSAGSTLALYIVMTVFQSLLSIESAYLLLPRRGLRLERVFVERGERAVLEQVAARDPHVRDLVAASGVHQLRDRKIQRLRLDVAEAHRRDIRRLARRERAGLIVDAQRLRAVERRHAQRGRGGQGAGVLRHGHGEQRGRAHLADQVEVVVARRAVGAERYIDACVHELLLRTKAAREFQVGLGTVRLARACARAGGDLVVGELRHVHCEQLRREQAELFQPRQRALAEGLLGLVHLERRLVHVHVDLHVQLIGQGAHAFERAGRHGIRRVRRERGGDERVILVMVVQREALAEVFVRICRPCGGKVDEDHAHRRAHAGLGRGACGLVGEKVHVVEACDAAAQHLGHRELGAVAREFGIHPGPFCGPDVIVEPVHE